MQIQRTRVKYPMAGIRRSLRISCYMPGYHRIRKRAPRADSQADPILETVIMGIRKINRMRLEADRLGT